MAENWIPGKQYYTRKPTNNTIFGSIHKTKDQALIVEELEGKFVIFIVEKTNPDNVLHEIERGIDSKSEAQSVANQWMELNEDGV